MYDVNKMPYFAVKEPQRVEEAYHEPDYRDLERNGRSYSFFFTETGDEQPEVKNLYADDEREKELQVGLHHVWKKVKANSLYSADLRGENLRVIDVGCGSAIWANELAQNAKYRVEGFDASRILPGATVDNCQLYHRDCNDSFPCQEGQTFDLIHVRQMLYCISDLRAFSEQCYSSLSLSGCVELSQAALIPEVNDHNLPGYRKWKLAVLAAATTNDIEINVVPERLFQAFGGANLATEMTSSDLEFTIQNKPLFSVFEAHFRAVSLRLLTLQDCSWPQAELTIADAMNDLKTGVAIIWKFITLIARKDFEPGQSGDLGGRLKIIPV